ncbi:MarR family winged helix-turn-helix transcriptional regulator [Nocardioides sp. CFH 31398]|uniref:MarR family winged helix-turn-helix transcriptional regulator n=1 Tax=Nocardioides sp. CFH 31398 TaxID=2919579 RepID=UPI001F05B2D3|nr:MarR family transcriptional regulator [Nocardioides sp. CFH 31398]MCH1867934.1 MarR family transcriptional regulator [Nocardioides sp. CFH 31398]
MSDEPWLSEAQKDGWSALGSLAMLLPPRVEAAQRGSGLSLFEYLVLSAISEAPDATLRMGELAHLSGGAPSRLSNAAKRFEERGWLTRRPDPADGRATLATLTDAGLDVVRAAAPLHARAVREVVVDRLDDDDLAALVRIAGRLGTWTPAARERPGGQQAG